MKGRLVWSAYERLHCVLYRYGDFSCVLYELEICMLYRQETRMLQLGQVSQ